MGNTTQNDSEDHNGGPGRQNSIDGLPKDAAGDSASKIDPEMGTPETHADPLTPQSAGSERGEQDDPSQAGRASSGADAQSDGSRSGADVAEAVDVAESGTRAQGDHSHPERAKSGKAPVEQVFNDPAMTEGQRTGTGSGPAHEGTPRGRSAADSGSAAGAGSAADAGSSGGAQSVVGARESDRLAAGEPPAAGAPFETGTEDQEAEPPGRP